MSSRATIPLVLHQTWKAADLPEPLQSFSDSWRRCNPDLAYRFYDDSACRDLVRTEFPEYLDVYDGFPFAIQRADFFRYLAVLRFGGVYADVDMECLRPITPFLLTDSAVFSIEARISRARQRELGYAHPYQIANCIFAAAPGHSFLRHIVEAVAALARARPARSLAHVEDTTGPRLLTRLFYDRSPQDIRVLEQIFWMPPGFYPNRHPLNRNMFARHHFLGSWKRQASTSLWRRWIERDLPPPPFPARTHHRFDRG